MVTCLECAAENVGSKADITHWVDLQDDDAYVGTCKNGHSVQFTLDNLRYEILYQSGIVALLFGFYREAVSSIAVATERFFEFASRAMLIHHGVEPAVVEEAWKHVKKQSQRQLGAFQFLYAATLRKPFREGKSRVTFDEQMSFRNNIIHLGELPPREEVVDYARYTFELIREIWANINAVVPSALQQARDQLVSQGRAKVESKSRVTLPLGRGVRWYRMVLADLADISMDFNARVKITEETVFLWGLPQIATPGNNAT
jgi:hypothetical protein